MTSSVTVKNTETQGLLNPKRCFPCGGLVPRHFTFDSSEQVLLVANQESNRISAFRVHTCHNGSHDFCCCTLPGFKNLPQRQSKVDVESGYLTFLNHIDCGTPMVLQIVE